MNSANTQLSNSKETRYFSFPLSLLTLTDDPEMLYQYICTYFITWHSEPFASGINEEEFEGLIDSDEYSISSEIALFYDLEDQGFCSDQIAFTAKRFEMGDVFIHECLATFEELTDFYFAYVNKYGNDSMLRIRKDIIEDMRTGDIDMNLFRTYCAILSYIGDKPYARVANSIISVRSAGFKSKDILEDYEERGKLFPVPLTISQVKTATKKLKERGFLLRLTITKNRTYYCNRLKPEEFANKLAEKLHKEYEKSKIDVFQHKLDELAKKLADKRSNDLGLTGTT